MQKKYLEPKKNQHYVWAHYMARWSDDKRGVWHTTPTGKVSRASVKGISREDYFYKAKELTPDHVHIIKNWSSFSPSSQQKLHMSYLSGVLKAQHVRKAYRESGVKSQELEQALFALECNIIENLHGSHEGEAKSIIDTLVSGDLSVLNNDTNLIKFISFFGQQISRTKPFKNVWSSIYPVALKEGDEAMRIHNLTEDCWWFLSYIFGMNIGWSLYSDRTKDNHCLLINKTETSFITSDRPVINVHASLKEGKIVLPEDDSCDFFYPLSPDTAYMINKSDRFPHGVTQISEGFAKEMNEKIAKASSTHIVGVNREAVDLYKTYVGKREATVRNHFFQ